MVIKSTLSTSIAGSEPRTRPFSPPDNSAVLQRAANRILRHSGSIGRYPHCLLFVFHRSGLILRLPHCRRPAFSSSPYPSSSHERLLAESDCYLQQFSAYLSRNSKHFLLQRVIIIILVRPTSINGRLSLLQDLVNGMNSSDEDNILLRLWYSRWSSGMGKDDEEAAACKAALGRRVSHAES